MAGYGAIRALVRPGDIVLLDEQAGSGLREGALRSTPRVLRYHHLDIDHLQRVPAAPARAADR
jgi:7-keto-8-aminopelargonate synthetase-like enzyme